MFSRKEKPLPVAVLKPSEKVQVENDSASHGILLGQGVYWTPERLPNGHVVAIGSSGSGKTQTLKAIAYELHKTYSAMQLVIIDFHGDQNLQDEVCYPLHMSSPYGVNPLYINLDPEGGGPNLQAIAVAATLKKALQMGPVQEGLLLEVLGNCYWHKGIVQGDEHTWTKDPPNFADLQTEIEHRVKEGCKDSAKLKLKLNATFAYGIFNRPAFLLEHRAGAGGFV